VPAFPRPVPNFCRKHEQSTRKCVRGVRRGGRAGAMRAIALCWRNARHRPRHAATHPPPAGPPEAHAEVLCHRRQRYKHTPVLERSPKSYSHRQKLVEGMSPRGLTCHCTDEAGYIYSSSLYICRVALLLLRQRRGAGLGELQPASGRSINAPAHTQRALHGAQSPRGKRGKITSFYRSGYTRACHRHFLFPVPKFHMEFLTLLRSFPPYFSRVLPASRLLLRARLCTCRRASAVT
jgi:hypothetical protein